MDLEKLKELKRELMEIRKGNFIFISKSFFMFLLNCVLLSFGCKFFFGSFPIVFEKEKKYKVESFNVSNNDTLNMRLMYVDEEQLNEGDFDCIIMTIKSKYMLDSDGKYMRNVCVYKFHDDLEFDYNYIFDNYEFYSNVDNKIDEYFEYYDNIEECFFNEIEVSVNYYVVDMSSYKYELEDVDNNKIANFWGIPMFCLFGGKFVYDVGSEFILIYYDEERRNIKKKIKKEKARLK